MSMRTTKLTSAQRGQLNRDERIKTERQQRDIRGRETIQELQNSGTLRNTRLEGQNQLQNTDLAGKNQIRNTLLGNRGQLDVTSLNNQGAMARQTAGDLAAEKIEGIRQTGENSRLATTGTQSAMADNRKLASDLLLNGRGGQQVEDLYNNQAAFGRNPGLAGIEPPVQRSEQPQAGTFKNIDVTDGEATSARTMLLDTRSGQLMSPPKLQTEQSAEQGDVDYIPDDDSYSYWNEQIGSAASPEARRRSLDYLKRSNPQLFQYMYQQQLRSAQQ